MSTPIPLPQAEHNRFAGRPLRAVPITRPLPPLDMKLLADLPSLELRANCVVDGFLSGRHRSPQKGSSVEFAEYRTYQPGDDLRRIDWRLYGRTDRLHTKQYEEETQLRVFVILDTSASMDFRSGGLHKMEYARIILAAIALLARRQGDAFGLGVVGRELDDFLPARGSTSHWRSFVGKLETVQPAVGRVSLAGVLLDLAEIIPPRSLIVIASDFYEDTMLMENAIRRLHYDHHDLIGVHVLDPVESDFNIDHAGFFVDAESPNRRLKLDAASVREGYLRRFGAFCAGLDNMFREAGGGTVRLRTDRPPYDTLTAFLAHRGERR